MQQAAKTADGHREEWAAEPAVRASASATAALETLPKRRGGDVVAPAAPPLRELLKTVLSGLEEERHSGGQKEGGAAVGCEGWRRMRVRRRC